jgi:hypothetical protein
VGCLGGAGGPSGAKGAGRLNRLRRSAHCFFDQVQLLAKDGLAPEEPGDVLERAQCSADRRNRPRAERLLAVKTRVDVESGLALRAPGLGTLSLSLAPGCSSKPIATAAR